METKKTNYYSLRYQLSDALHKAGERIIASEDIVRIGQQSECDVCLLNDSPYMDELFAIIRPCRCMTGWQLVPVSEYVQTKVNGNPVILVHYLEDGDRITFGDWEQELLFNVRNDGKYDSSMGTIMVSSSISRKIIALLALLPVILFGILFYEDYQTKQEEQRLKILLDKAKHSVLQLSVDSVYYVEETSSSSRILRRFSYVESEGKAINGTAFLTTNGYLFTARHCIEPWLNDGDIMTGNPMIIKSVPTKWALEAETYNQMHDNDTVYKVVSMCTFSRGELAEELLEGRCKSSDFVYDTTRDDIIELGDFNYEYYWRSIQRKPSRSDMMLGDLAYLPFVERGMIAVPMEADMEDLVKERNKLYFMGYPEYQVASGYELSEGKVKRNYHAEEMIAHNGRLIHGYSGGPALAIKGDSIYAVGIISIIDSKGGDRMYSVPINQWKKGGKIND